MERAVCVGGRRRKTREPRRTPEQQRAWTPELEPHLQGGVVGMEGHDVSGPRFSLDDCSFPPGMTREAFMPQPRIGCSAIRWEANSQI